ncbi:helix-turn-helix domain-containing protein [Natronobiforma cellulositropha]|uniref:helix-turn-helix domain-containing protein n=1 Tax=Natronobiforma cellulositropha TaxID=1679076 RepID=UPI0021D5D7EE|nr:helix-turn-helix domain-containing protein [Natronobiforma cellulositropha]
MVQATLTVTMPEELWVSQVSTAHPDVAIRVVAAVPGTDTGFALVRLVGPGLETILEALADHPQLPDLTIAHRDDGEATVALEMTALPLLVSSREAGIPIELPIEISDGEATIEVTGSRERLSKLATQLTGFGLGYRVEQVSEHRHEGHVLSERQLEVVLEALEEGYYDTPRRCSLTELATHLGVAKSTCSETLHRAEEAIVKAFVEDLPLEE